MRQHPASAGPSRDGNGTHIASGPPVPAIAAPMPPLLPVGIIAAMIALAGAGSGWVGLSLTPNIYAVFAPGAALFLAAGWLWRQRQLRLCETAVFLGLWWVWPPVCVWLAYLSFVAGFPLQDGALAAMDAVLGFHWIGVAHAVEATPGLRWAMDFVYVSPLWQFAVTVPALAWLGPRGRNGQFLTQMLLAMSVSLAINTVVPAIGPAAALGLHPPPEPIILALRSGSYRGLPYVGIVSFPSFHTVMAILFPYAHRGIRRTFAPMLALNAAMLVATLYCGDHFLVDMLAGAVVALAILAVTPWLDRAAAALQPASARPAPDGAA